MTIVEVVVSAAIVSMVAGGAMMGLEATGKTAADQRDRSRADAVAQQDQERLRGMSSAQLASLNQTRNVDMDGMRYTVTSTGQFLNRSTGGSSCTGTGGTADYVKVTSSVTWRANRRFPVVVESIITPPIGGTLQVRVLDQNGTLLPPGGLPGATVTAVKGTDSFSALSDASGCVVFAGTELGDYNITASRANYVDFNGNTSVSVVATTTSSDSTSIDLPQIGSAGGMNARFDTRIGATILPNQLAPSLMWNNAAMALPKTVNASSANGSATITTPVNLFPFIVGATANNYTGNYLVWGGSCTDDKPPTPSTASVFPGPAIASPTVRLPALILNVRLRTSSMFPPITPDNIKLTDACAKSWYPPVIPRTPTSPGNPLGQLRFPGQPYAPSSDKYQVCADVLVSGVRYKGAITTANADFVNGTTPSTLVIDSRFAANRGTC